MKFAVTTIAVSISLLTGCASSLNEEINAIKPRVEKSRVLAERLLASQTENAVPGPVAFSNQSWIPLRKIERTERELANQRTDKIQIEINQRFTSLNDVASSVSSLSKIPVSVGSDVPTGGTGAGASMQVGAPLAVPPLPTGLPGMMAPMPGMAGVAPNGNGAQYGSGVPSGAITGASPFVASYSGSLTGYLNMVAAYYGISWKVDESGIRFFVMDSKTFRIAALPGDTRLNSSVESVSSSSGGGGTGNATQSGSSSNSTGVGFSGLSVWGALETAIKQMLNTGGKVIASPATGTITVTDTPAVLQRVTAFVNSQNQALNRLVTVNVRVLSVELNDGDDYGINWDAVYKNLAAASGAYTIALKTAFPVASGAGNLVLSAPSNANSRWAGSSAMIDALSTQGRVTELTSASVVTLNNQPSPINVGRKVSYLASSSQTQTANVGSTTSLTPGTIQTGFSMTLIPHIIDSRELLLQYSMDLSSLLRLNTITSGGASIQAPDVSTSNFIQRVRMQSNETLVVAGFDQDNLSAVARGVGVAENALLGGRTGSVKRTMLVIMLQPSIAQ